MRLGFSENRNAWEAERGTEEKKRLLLVAEGWDGSVGGVQRYLRGLMEHVRNFEVTVVGPEADRPKEFSIQEEGPKYEVLERRFYWPFLKPKWLPLWWFVKGLVKKQNPAVILGGKALFEGLLLKKLGRPYGLFTYAMEIERWLEEGREERLRLVLGDAAVVFYLNNKTRERLLALGVVEDRLVWLPPAVEEFFLREADGHKLREELAVRSPYVLTVGRLVSRKGIDVVLEAFAKLEHGNLELVIVGEGPELETLQSRARELGLNNDENIGRVKFLGSVSDEQLRALYVGCELFALAPRELPGDMEGFGIVFLEAAAQSKPAVATRTGGVVEAVEDGVTGLLVGQDDVNGMAEAMTRVLQDKGLARQLGDAGRMRVWSKFTWQQMAGVLETALNRIV